ncbi:MAG: hypothetical protein GEU83_12205 [Pseudonocardiaceae bacterium]|nr:hypothetical protein [Pseudonocardiaceae bacterium]
MSRLLRVGLRCFGNNPYRYMPQLEERLAQAAEREDGAFRALVRVQRKGTASEWTSALRGAGYRATYQWVEDRERFIIYVRPPDEEG